ncbi:hypothetical protein [Lysobacter capsici]|uniref:hypothetical protein n=1 Tax=Lysobacter capsici TaxID=435897 RepID=UPI0012FDCEF2|nr:hypothetical protein [Lysobacter capsici]
MRKTVWEGRFASVRRAVAIAGALCLLAACASNPKAEAKDWLADCSGVPGDPTTPAALDTAGPATHGPGAPGRAVRLVASLLPEEDLPVPPVYIFGAHGEHITGPDAGNTWWSADPTFERLRDEAYWGEVVDRRFYRVPWLGQCEIGRLLPHAEPMRGPPGGLLFLQFLTPDCAQCGDASAAIERLVAAHPELPVRWVQIQVPAR